MSIVIQIPFFFFSRLVCVRIDNVFCIFASCDGMVFMFVHVDEEEEERGVEFEANKFNNHRRWKLFCPKAHQTKFNVYLVICLLACVHQIIRAHNKLILFTWLIFLPQGRHSFNFCLLFFSSRIRNYKWSQTFCIKLRLWLTNEDEMKMINASTSTWLHTHIFCYHSNFDAHHSHHHQFSYGLDLPDRLFRNAAILNTNFSFQLI